MKRTIRERLYARLTLCADPGCDCDGCLLWPGRVHPRDGYGRIWADGQMRLVHRVAWQLENGPIPDGLVLDHVRARGCRHRNCGKVAHLEPVTNRENILRGDSWQAKNAAKVRCDSGHLFDETNTYLAQKRGHLSRGCRACNREAVRRYKARRVLTS